MTKSKEKIITVAVAGNPNVGKSTLINAIAGSKLQVGNWTGVTVEKKEALIKIDNQNIKLVDLPGTYNLSPYTEEEIIARDFIIFEKPDIIVNVVDSTNLERNLALTIQLLELGIPIILVLNKYYKKAMIGHLVVIQCTEKRLVWVITFLAWGVMMEVLECQWFQIHFILILIKILYMPRQ